MLDVILDAFWGSCGKGKVSDWWVATRGVTDVVSGNMPNAGHTVVRGDKKVVAKVLPSAAFFNRDCDVWLSASSGFTEEQYHKEIMLLRKEQKIHVHDRAFNVTDKHAMFERDLLSGISSTMQGSAVALCEKIMRQNQKTLSLVSDNIVISKDWREVIRHRIIKRRVMFEVAQGWGLSIDHGTQYPNCTSRNCSVQRALDDCACPPKHLGDVIAVIRPYPIRVGNTSDGYSGDFMPDCVEVDWCHVEKVSGCNGLAERERTTVTKRIRRVSTFSFELLSDCVRHNGVTGIFLNFAQYIDSECTGKRGKLSDAPRAVRIFADAIQNHTGVKVIAAGTGADTFDVLEA